jgi:hypothetical protein
MSISRIADFRSLRNMSEPEFRAGEILCTKRRQPSGDIKSISWMTRGGRPWAR